MSVHQSLHNDKDSSVTYAGHSAFSRTAQKGLGQAVFFPVPSLEASFFADNFQLR